MRPGPYVKRLSRNSDCRLSYPLIFLPFISSAFVPTDTTPGPVRAFAENQPVTSIVIVAYGFAIVTYRRKIA